MLCMYIFFLNVCLPSFFHVDVPETKQELHRITSLFFSSYIRSYTGWFIEIPVMVKKQYLPQRVIESPVYQQIRRVLVTGHVIRYPCCDMNVTYCR